RPSPVRRVIRTRSRSGSSRRNRSLVPSPVTSPMNRASTSLRALRRPSALTAIVAAASGRSENVPPRFRKTSISASSVPLAAARAAVAVEVRHVRAVAHVETPLAVGGHGQLVARVGRVAEPAALLLDPHEQLVRGLRQEIDAAVAVPVDELRRGRGLADDEEI